MVLCGSRTANSEFVPAGEERNYEGKCEEKKRTT
jgi:hypothetical protein